MGIPQNIMVSKQEKFQNITYTMIPLVKNENNVYYLGIIYVVQFYKHEHKTASSLWWLPLRTQGECEQEYGPRIGWSDDLDSVIFHF